MNKNDFWMVDSFTTVALTGNPAGVVWWERAIDEKAMIAIAREIGASESAFITAFDQEKRRLSIRFFTPTQEVGLCTHASIAAFHILATEFGARSGSYEMHSPGGVFEVLVGFEAAVPTVTLIQVDRGLQHTLSERQLASAAQALGCAAQSCVEAVVWKAATPRVLVNVANRHVLDSLAYDRSLLIALGQSLGSPGFYCYTAEGAESPIIAHTRMFSPATGIQEDPVTGNAAAALALYQRSRGLLEEGERAVYAQGEAMGRPGTVAVTVRGGRAYIDGSATTIWRASLLV